MNAADAVLAASIQDYGNSTALICGDDALTYLELFDMVNRFGNGLRSHNVERENRVLLMLKDSPDLVAAYLGTMKIGAVAVALNAHCAAADLLFAINDTCCKLLIIDQEYLPMYQGISGQLVNPPYIVVAGSPASGFPTLGIFTATQSPVLASTPMSPDDMAFWVYTSGATGPPKAAVHSQHDVLLSDRYLREAFLVGPGDRLFCTSKLFFAYALCTCLFGVLRCGATMLLLDGPAEPAAIIDVVERLRPRIVFGIPTVYRDILGGSGDEEAGAFPVSPAGEGLRSVEYYVASGERLPLSLSHAWTEWTGRPVYETFGTSETLCMIFANSPAAQRAGSSGKLAPGIRAKLLDEDGHVVETPGVAGELWVGALSLCDRYWNQQERSRRAFEGFWFRTGDLFCKDEDGFWYHRGRTDDALKIAGHWVSPHEIEDAAVALPGVAEAAVVLRHDEGLAQLSLFITPAVSVTDRIVFGRHLREHLALKLGPQKCPREICFVDQVPRTASGKIQRYRLRDRASEIA
ncbi:MAG: AMP-binding protein [Xanthobacteraceae bacterium]